MKRSALFAVIASLVLNGSAHAQIHLPTAGVHTVPPVIIYSPPTAPRPVFIYDPPRSAPMIVVPPAPPAAEAPHVHLPEQHCYAQRPIDRDGDGKPDEWIMTEVPCNHE